MAKTPLWVDYSAMMYEYVYKRKVIHRLTLYQTTHKSCCQYAD